MAISASEPAQSPTPEHLRLPREKPPDQLALDIGDLAGEEQLGAGLLDDPLDDVLVFGAASSTVLPMLIACVTVPGTAVRRTNSPRIGAVAKPAAGPHVDGDVAGELLQPEHVDHMP
jgi:hypothetical protein